MGGGWVCVVTLLAAAATLSCGSDGTGPTDAPDGHTVVLDGAAHAPGYRSPVGTCTTCHGADLRGGPDGEPSCFRCHGRQW
jgi:cytochrome c553